MGVSEIKPGAVGFGQRRFIVRERGAVPEATLVALRPHINEYPELFPLDPVYPVAGRRGGSRAPRAVGGPAGEGASAEPAPAVLSFDPYPLPRPREGADSDFNLGGGLPPPAAAPGCGIARGGMWRSSPEVAAGGTSIEVSGVIARPFKIIHVSYWSANASPTGSNMAMTLFISDSAGTANTPGELGQEVPFFHPAGGATPYLIRTQHFPNWVVSEPGKRLKVRWVNSSAGALETYLVVDFEYLD